MLSCFRKNSITFKDSLNSKYIIVILHTLEICFECQAYPCILHIFIESVFNPFDFGFNSEILLIDVFQSCMINLLTKRKGVNVQVLVQENVKSKYIYL